MSLSFLLGESEPWLLAFTAGILGLLLVVHLILSIGGQRRQPKPEDENISRPAQVDPQIEVEEDEENDSSTDSESETEPLTTYCKNGCQGACACPALNPSIKNSEPTLSLHLSLSGPDVPPPESSSEVTANVSQSSLRKRSKPIVQFFKDKVQGNHGGSELNESGSKGSDRKRERRKSRFDKWRKKKSKRRSSEQETSSHDKTDSPKSHRGKNREDS